MSASNVKSVLHDVTLKIQGLQFMSVDETPIVTRIIIKELIYGPVLSLRITTDIPYTYPMEWSDHPLARVDKEHLVEDGKAIEEIIDDTPAIRAVIAELVDSKEQKLYVTTDCTHRAQLIAFLSSCWS